MDDHSAQVILPLLGEGEEILWAGQPKQGVVIENWHLWRAFSGFIFVILIVFSIVEYWRRTGSAVISVTALVICLSPFAYLAYVHLIENARARRHTHYGLTNRRLLIVTERSRREVFLNQHEYFEIVDRDNGRGTILLEKEMRLPLWWGLAALRRNFFTRSMNLFTGSQEYKENLQLIAGVDQVHALILEARRKLHE